MGMMRYNYMSEALNLCVDLTITYPSGKFTYVDSDAAKSDVPAQTEKRMLYTPGMKFQTVYLLHGGSDDDTTILRNTRLEHYAEQNCVMTVCPQAKDSFYADTLYGFQYFTFITQELPQVVQSLFASSPSREDNFVLGLAMGGNGALSLALRRPDLYAACVDLSGGIGCSVDTEYFIQELKTLKMRRLQSAFPAPEQIPGSAYDLGWYARRNIEEKREISKLFLAVGEDDFIRDVVRKDRDALLRLGYPLHYEEAPGQGHDWDFWNTYLEKALCQWLPLKRRPV